MPLIISIIISVGLVIIAWTGLGVFLLARFFLWLLELGYKMLRYVFLFLIASTTAFSATTGSITISGVVPGITAIVVTPQVGYNNLDLTTTQVDKTVATVRELNNTALGYTVRLTSQNAGTLKNGTLGNIPYTAKYGSSSVALTASPVTITTQGPQNSVINVLKDFKISYTGSPSENNMNGTYSDTLTFTIIAN